MSAIFGMFRFDGMDVAPRDLERMADALVHRGPDGRKYTAAGGIGLGHCLMRVNREDLFEVQPWCDPEAGLTLVADCRLDNRQQLAAIFGIAAPELRSMPDSALLMRAYKTWGENCAEHLLGDFAFAVWHARARKLLLARDHMGLRYVLYHRSPGFLAFATEAKALWAVPDVPRQLSEATIGRWLLGAPSTTSDATLFDGICQVSGGTTVVVQADGKIATRRYWEPHADPAWLNRSEDDYVGRFRAVLAEAVESRIGRLIGPPALCLSAGFDSAAIAGVAGPAVTAHRRKLITVSSVLAEGHDHVRGNVRRWVESCRRHMPHLDVRYVCTDAEDIVPDTRSFLYANGLPDFADPVNDKLFQAASAAGARLVMDGFGGDDTLNPHGGAVLTDWLRAGQFRRFFREARAHLRIGSRSLGQILLNDIIVGQAPFRLRQAWRKLRRAKPPWAILPIAPAFAARLIDTGIIDAADMYQGLHPYSTQHSRLIHDLRMASAMPSPPCGVGAAARGLDLTRPMLDRRVVEFGLAIPQDLWVKDGWPRHLARRALCDVYPPEFQSRLRSGDSRMPGFFEALRAALPALEAEIERLRLDANLNQYFDFASIENALRDANDFDPVAAASMGSSEAKRRVRARRALRAFHAASYIAWFDRANVSR